VLAVPWYDMGSVVLLRLSQGRSPFHADKQHLSHRLADRGLGSRWAVRVIYLLALVSGGGGLLGYWLPEPARFVPFGVVAGAWALLALVEFWWRPRVG
jgi:UDP-GlcNAc:undecaprenyl-phosphate GlcNAc-1-phosphate transferase